nr:hypothetical protein [Tanacetum cinerariifolium]
MSYDDIRLIFKDKFNTNIKFLLKSKEEIEEEENRALESINETPAQKAAKKRRLNEEAEDIEEIKQHLEIVPDEDYDEDKPKVQEAVEVVTTAKLITEVVAAISEAVSAASANIDAAVVPAATIITASVKVVAASTRQRRGVVIRDPEEESTAE